MKVPLEFSTVRHWAQCIGNNLLAEYWHMVQEGKGRGKHLSAVATGPKDLNVQGDEPIMCVCLPCVALRCAGSTSSPDLALALTVIASLLFAVRTRPPPV